MSEFNEELLNDVDDYPDVGEADEDALLQDDDDGDVLDLVPEELEESLDDSKVNISEQDEEDVETHREKFAVERQLITAPESSGKRKTTKDHNGDNDVQRLENELISEQGEKETEHFTGELGGKKTEESEQVDETNTPRQNNRFPRNNQGFPRGRGGNNVGRGRFQRGRGRPAYGGQPGRNKTVLINPRFQGVVHVNNNARLAWDTPQQPQYHNQNPWASGTPPGQMVRQVHPVQGPMAGPPMQSGPPMQQPTQGFHGHMQPHFHGPPMQPMHQEPQMQHGQMQPIQNMGPPVQNIGPLGQQLHYIPPQQHIPPPQQPFMPQPLPPGVQPIQNPPRTPYWDGQNQFTPVEQSPYMHGGNNYQPPGMMNNQAPSPQIGTPNFQMYNQQGNISPMPQQNFNPNFSIVSQNNQGFPNNSPAPAQYNHGNGLSPNRRELFTQKRKVMTPGFSQNKKVFLKDRLGPAQQPPKIERPSVVKEVTVTNVTTIKIEEDEQTRDLRLKIEEQKRKREAILQWKEKRRLEMLTGKVEDTSAAKVITQQVNQQSPVKMETKQLQNIPVRKQAFKQVKQIGQPVKQVIQPVKQVIQPVKQVVQPINQVIQQVVHTVTSQSPNRPIKFKKHMGNNIVITNGYSRKYTKYQQKKDKQSSRVVLAVPTTPLPVPEPELELDKKHLSSFLADRKILTKDESLMSTRKVVIKNISTSTGDKKIFQISKNIGEVQKLHRDKNKRQATITFKSVASAHAFFKKYQRHMLDLSMIEVTLCPMSESDQ